MSDIGDDDDKFCDIEVEKLVNVDGSTALSRFGGVSKLCPVAERGWDNCRCRGCVSGGEPLFLSSEAVATEWRRGTGMSVFSSPTWGLADGDERAELLGLVESRRFS